MAKVKTRLTLDREAIRRAAEIDVRILSQIGDLVVTQIVGLARARSQGTREFQADSTPLPELSEGYIRTRQRANNPTGDSITIPLNTSITRANQRRSNLTYTGELLDSLNFRVDQSNSRIIIAFEGNHQYANIPNETLYEYLQELNTADSSYEILNLNSTLTRRILEQLTDFVARRIRELN